MNRIFSVDGQVFRFLSAAYQLLVLNLITLLFCLPIVTIFGSISAAFHVLFEIEEQQEVPVWQLFWQHFKANLLVSSLINLYVFLVIGGLGVLIYVLGDTVASFPLLLAMAFSLIVALTVAMTLGKEAGTLRELLNRSLVLDLKYTGFFALAFSLFVIWFLVPIFLPRLGFLWFFFAFSLPMFISSKIYSYTLKHLTDKIQE
ncbi:YesL family protein [Fundicoccus culcitae]|uniref:YesL family protein n=1 Tax=Fundicoccus culcitae TaxID=2969821 RepID=A0ABY5P353_9LACT|nr:YesL family protein [Fundicoccus culcitae]UUX33157.1 YesL family protein [Fundicoccus culcitae]